MSSLWYLYILETLILLKTFTVFGHFQGSNGLWLLKLDCDCWNTPVSVFHGSIMDMWCVAGLIWTHLSSPPDQNQYGTGTAYTPSVAMLRQFLATSIDPMDCDCWNSSSVSVFYGTIHDMWCVAGLIWIHISSQSHQKQPQTGTAHHI
jgi:hypothetical protein